MSAKRLLCFNRISWPSSLAVSPGGGFPPSPGRTLSRHGGDRNTLLIDRGGLPAPERCTGRRVAGARRIPAAGGRPVWPARLRPGAGMHGHYGLLGGLPGAGNRLLAIRLDTILVAGPLAVLLDHLLARNRAVAVNRGLILMVAMVRRQIAQG